MNDETQKVDVLAVMDSAAKTLSFLHGSSILSNDVLEARAAVAELIEAASNFLSADDIAKGYGSGIGGPDHDRLEAAIARIGGDA